jgi:hypothetical protein
MKSYFRFNTSDSSDLVRLLKLWPVRVLVVGWFVILVSIAMSMVQTGNFLFEYGPDSGRPEIVTPYFKVVAATLFVQIGLISTWLAWTLTRK